MYVDHVSPCFFQQTMKSYSEYLKVFRASTGCIPSHETLQRLPSVRFQDEGEMRTDVVNVFGPLQV